MSESTSTWDLYDSYKPDEFHMAMEGHRRGGDTATVTARVPVAIHSEISKLVQGGLFPYKQTSEFIRDAIYHRLAWCQSVGGVTTPAMKAEYHLARMEAANRTAYTFQRSFQECESGLRAALEETAWAQVRLLLDLAEAAALESPPPYSERYMELVERTKRRLPAGFFDIDIDDYYL